MELGKKLRQAERLLHYSRGLLVGAIIGLFNENDISPNLNTNSSTFYSNRSAFYDGRDFSKGWVNEIKRKLVNAR